MTFIELNFETLQPNLINSNKYSSSSNAALELTDNNSLNFLETFENLDKKDVDLTNLDLEVLDLESPFFTNTETTKLDKDFFEFENNLICCDCILDYYEKTTLLEKRNHIDNKSSIENEENQQEKILSKEYLNPKKSFISKNSFENFSESKTMIINKKLPDTINDTSNKVLFKNCFDNQLLNPNIMKTLLFLNNPDQKKEAVEPKKQELESNKQSYFLKAHLQSNLTLYKPIEVNFIHNKYGEIVLIISRKDTTIKTNKNLQFKENLNKKKSNIRSILDENGIQSNEIQII